jgi:omega-6 fatty acid desaturase (delta-12 desaturase)
MTFYNLSKAQAALKQANPGMVREQTVSFGSLWQIPRDLHLYDDQAGFYTDFSRTKTSPIPLRGNPGKE